MKVNKICCSFLQLIKVSISELRQKYKRGTLRSLQAKSMLGTPFQISTRVFLAQSVWHVFHVLAALWG